MPSDSIFVDPVYIGAGAGVLTSVLWVLTSLFFTAAGRRISITAVNTLRIVVAIGLLGTTQLLVFGTVVPDFVDPMQIVMLALSGLIGLSLCDQALFTAFLDIGPRRALLFMTASPVFAAIFGAAFLGEFLNPVAFLGMLVTIGGILFVILEKRDVEPRQDRSGADHFRRGVILALIAAVSQAAGGMFSKLGIGVGWIHADAQMSTLSATLTRMVFGLFGMAPIVLIHVMMLRKAIDRKRVRPQWKIGILLTMCGAFVGPFLGVWMSLVAFKNSPLGVAQTLASLSPVFILPFSHFLLGDRVSARAAGGAVVAMLGAAVLAFAPAIYASIAG